MWLFRKRDRLLFRYFDGRHNRSVDPLSAIRALDSHETFRFDDHAPALLAGDLAASKIAVDAVREIFGIHPWSESSRGLTEGETLAVLWKFVAFNEDIKKKLSPPPISPLPTELQPLEPSTMQPDMVSGSILSGQSGG